MLWRSSAVARLSMLLGSCFLPARYAADINSAGNAAIIECLPGWVRCSRSKHDQSCIAMHRMTCLNFYFKSPTLQSTTLASDLLPPPPCTPIQLVLCVSLADRVCTDELVVMSITMTEEASSSRLLAKVCVHMPQCRTAAEPRQQKYQQSGRGILHAMWPAALLQDALPNSWPPGWCMNENISIPTGKNAAAVSNG